MRFLLPFLLALPVHAASISESENSRQLVHGQPYVEIGNYGNKSTLPIWDDASGPDIRKKWDGVWPNQNPSANTTYRLPQRDVPLPHNRITRYIAGAHAPGGGFDAGANVAFWKNRTITYPAYTYLSYYRRLDDGWTFAGDDNLKEFAFSVCCSPYELPNNWYISYNDGPRSKTGIGEYMIADDKTGGSGTYGFWSIQDPDVNGHGHWWGNYKNPVGVWVKVEIEIKYSNQPDGYIKMWEDGVLKINHRGHNDRYSGIRRTEGVGGFARARNMTNWRYFADVYLDYSVSRFVLTDSSVYAQSKVFEVQPPLAWEPGKVTLQANGGRLAPGVVHLHFLDGQTSRYVGQRVLK